MESVGTLQPGRPSTLGVVTLHLPYKPDPMSQLFPSPVITASLHTRLSTTRVSPFLGSSLGWSCLPLLSLPTLHPYIFLLCCLRSKGGNQPTPLSTPFRPAERTKCCLCCWTPKLSDLCSFGSRQLREGMVLTPIPGLPLPVNCQCQGAPAP